MARAASLLASVAPIGGGPSPTLGFVEPEKAFRDICNHRDFLGSQYDEAISFAFPGRRGIMNSGDNAECYDDTAVNAAGEFASRVQEGIAPNFTRFAAHVAGVMIADEDEKKAVNQELQLVDEFIFEQIHSSNFTTEFNEALMDTALGTAALEIDEGGDPFTCEAVPLAELHFGLGPDGAPDPVARERHLTVREIMVLAPFATLPTDIEQLVDGRECKHRVIVIHQRDWSDVPAHRYRCTWFLPDKSNKIIWQYETEGVGSRKMLVWRWSKVSGEVWGRGPLLQCLPSMRVVNYAMKAVIDHGELALAGIWSAEDDGVFNTDTVVLEPGIIVPRAPGSQALENVVPQGRFDIQQFMLEEHRTNIKKALFTNQLGRPDKTPMTKAEVDERMAELARAIGAPFGRMVTECIMPFVARVRFILKRKKLIELPEVDGKEIKAKATSPLAEGQRFNDIDRVTKYISTLGGLFGPEAAALVVDTTEAALYLAERFQVPEKITRSRQAQQQLSAQIAQAAQQGGGMDGQAAGAAAPAA